MAEQRRDGGSGGHAGADGGGRRSGRPTGGPRANGRSGGRRDGGAAADRRKPDAGKGDRAGRGGEPRRDGRKQPDGGLRAGRDAVPERAQGPELPEDLTARELDPAVRRELRGLPKNLADVVARHLVMADRLLDEDPELAYRHAYEARRRAARLGVVREAAGLAAYRTGRWQEALADLRAARRMTGSDSYLPVLADCERGMGRPRRAVEAARSKEAERLDPAAQVEMRIVESGARRDLGEYDAAVLGLQDPRLWNIMPPASRARLYYAYADALGDAGKTREAEEWLARAAAADEAGETDAAERLEELDGVTFIDIGEDNESE